MYKKFGKRLLDIVTALLVFILLWWLYVLLAVLVRIKLGAPVLFKQIRPGKNGDLFYIYKFRSMRNRYDDKGELLPDAVRLTKFGKFLRQTSLDELPEFWNILIGQMSLVGPRPQLVKDMVFFDKRQMKRQSVLPGLTGLAQVNGRNSISWEEKIDYDLRYVENITFLCDVKIVLQTIHAVFIQQDGVNCEGLQSAKDFGDVLLENGKISREAYEQGIRESKRLTENYKKLG